MRKTQQFTIVYVQLECYWLHNIYNRLIVHDNFPDCKLVYFGVISPWIHLLAVSHAEYAFYSIHPVDIKLAT